MKAIVYHGPRHMRLEHIERPAAGRHEALIRVEAAGICGSELEGYLGHHGSVRIPPLVMGHECCGTVVEMPETADADPDIAVGDKVVVNPLISCGGCDRCLTGMTNLCRSRQLIGIHRPGAFAEYVAAPRSSLRRIPREIDSSLAALAEPLAVGIHALKLVGHPLGNTIIYGAGAIGLLALQAAQHSGVRSILVVEKHEARLNHARMLGAEVAEPERLAAKVNAVFAREGVDTIIDCVGVTATREQALTIVNPGGRIMMVGLGHEQSPVMFSRLVRQEVSVTGSYSYTDEDFGHAAALIVGGKIRPDDWLATCELADGPDCFRLLAEGQSAFSKIVLKP